MTHSGRTRSSSSLNNGISDLGMSLRKKGKLALLQVFQQGRKSEDEDEQQQQQRLRTNTGLVDYLKGKKPRSSSSISSGGFFDGDWSDEKLPKPKSGYHTWSLRRSTPNWNNSNSPTRGSPKTPKKLGPFATLGRSKKGRRSALGSSTFSPTAEVPELGLNGSRSPEPYVGAFPDQVNSNSDYIELCCANNASTPVSNDDSGDYDEISSGSSEERQNRLSRNPSSASRSSTSAMPPSPSRPPRSFSSSNRGSPNLFRRLNATLSPRQRRQARPSNNHVIRASSTSEEEEVLRSLDDCDVTKASEDVFDTWDGRNAVTLPRRPKKISGKELDSYESASDAKDSASGKNKFKRPSIIRPQSMMINRPAQYTGPHAGYPGGPASRTRPVSTIKLGVSSDLHSSNNKSNRSSIYEEEEDGNGTPPSSYLSSTRDLTSGSMESLDEASDIHELENDPDLMLKPDEPDSWSVTAEKKTLKKMSRKEIKRQDNIYEIIQTERNYLTVLKIMQRIYARALSKELHYDQSQIDKFFPLIDEHVDFVSQFVQKLTERQADKKVVDRIGDVLLSQWSGDSGENMKRILGEFCCRHNEIVNQYKENMKNEKKFQNVIRKCEKNALTRRQGIPECALLVTQRITKYPMMVQALLENSKEKDHKDDHEDLTRSLELSKQIAKDIDDQVQTYERQRLLADIYEKTEAKASTTYKDGRKFLRKDLLRRNRKLLFSNTVQLKITRKLTAETLFLLLSDCIVFLQENGGKYSFPSGQPAVVPLQNLLVREVANDEKGLFLLSPGSQLMYEMKTSTSDECKTLMQKTRVAVGNCPDQDEGVPSEDEEERRIQDQQLDKARKLISKLESKDHKINELLGEKMKVLQQLADSVDRGNSLSRTSYSYPTFHVSTEDLSKDLRSVPPCAPALQKALEQVTKLSNAIYGAGGLSRHPSSVGEHDSGTKDTGSLPKRSDTFGGFDNGKEPPSPRSKYLNTSQSDTKLKELERDQLCVSESSKRDSGLVDLDITVARSDSQSSSKMAWPPNNPSSSQNPSPATSQVPDEEFPLVPPTNDQVTALTQINNLFNQFLSLATQKDTHLEKVFLQQMQDRGSSAKKRAGTLADAELKRNQMKQQEQMDDLRRQQEQLKNERDNFYKTHERFQKSMDRDREKLAEETKNLQKSKYEIDERLNEVNKLKEEHQRELSRLREIQRRTIIAAQSDNLHVSSSTSALSSASNKNNSNNFDTTDARIASDPSSKSSLSGSKSFSSLHVTGPDSTRPPSSPIYANASDYPRTFPGMNRDAAVASNVPNPSAAHHNLPIHLQYSATNQLSAPPPQKQQQSIPMKIANLGKSEKHGVQQLIPSKLSKLASGQSNQHHPSSSDSSRGKHTFGRKRGSNPEMTTTPSYSSLQVPSSASVGHKSANQGRLSPSNAANSVTPSPLSDDSAVERSNSSSSSKDGERQHARRYNTKHDLEEGMELFF